MLMQIAEVRFLGSYTRLRSDVDENYTARLRSDEWEVPVCELVSTCHTGLAESLFTAGAR